MSQSALPMLGARRDQMFPTQMSGRGAHLFEDHALRCAGKPDSDACGEDALELHPSPFNWNDTVSFVI